MMLTAFVLISSFVVLSQHIEDSDIMEGLTSQSNAVPSERKHFTSAS